MDLRSKLSLLSQLYDIYDDFVETLDLACERFCSTCCTCNVTLTTLEGYRIINGMDQDFKGEIFEKIDSACMTKRFQPRLTTNQLAQKCVNDEDIPEELSDPALGNCFLLCDNECPIYDLRPFGCRCLISKKICSQTGYADIDEFVLTVNNVFQQIIEHIDADGVTGNLSDVLLFLHSAKNNEFYQAGKIPSVGPGLIPNTQAPVWMVPPHHRDRLKPILRAIQNIKPDLSDF
jgi:hypothetical protein